MVSLRNRNACWESNKEFAYSTLKAYETQGEWHKEDEELLRERITYNEAMCVVEVLLEGLKKALEDNPFPGQRKRLLPVATELFPDAGVSFEWKVVSKGERLWRKVFSEGGISCEIDKIRFPEVDEININEIEMKLFELVGEEGYLRVSAVAVAMNTKVRSCVYVKVRGELQKRGWVWGVRKVKGKVEKVVFPPTKR